MVVLGAQICRLFKAARALLFRISGHDLKTQDFHHHATMFTLLSSEAFVQDNLTHKHSGLLV